MKDNIQLIHGDCIIEMQNIPDKSVDAIICDLPYGTTASSWDKIINLKDLWSQYLRIIKDDRAICLFGSGAFTYKLISSMPELYRYKWIWFKNKRGNFVNAKNRPMTSYEEIMIFSKGCTANGSKIKMLYNPQGLIKQEKIRTDKSGTRFGTMAGKRPSHKETIVSEYTNYPFDVLQFECETKPQHPTQKPIALIEYLIKTYSNEGDLILDNTAGSMTTAIAAINTNRRCICIEKDDHYFEIGSERVKKHLQEQQLKLF